MLKGADKKPLARRAAADRTVVRQGGITTLAAFCWSLQVFLLALAEHPHRRYKLRLTVIRPGQHEQRMAISLHQALPIRNRR